MPVQIACPKCSKQYKLPDSVLGKAVKCKQCGTAFRTKAPGAQPSSSLAQAKGPATPAKQNLSEFGIDDDFQKQPDLFGAPLPPQQATAGLGNFAAEDPGFGDSLVPKAKSTPSAKVADDENPYASVLTNPALRNTKNNAGRGGGGATVPVGAIGSPAKIVGYVYIVFTAIGVVSLFAAVAMLVAIGLPGDEVAELSGGHYALLASVAAGVGFGLLAQIIALVFWALAHSNTSKLGATGQVFSPGWMIGCWFVPFANLIWPYQGIAEIYQASVKPQGSKWKKVPVPGLIGGAWAVFVIVSIADRIIDKTTMDVVGRTADFILAGQLAMWAISLLLFIFVVQTVIKAQYKHQSS